MNSNVIRRVHNTRNVVPLFGVALFMDFGNTVNDENLKVFCFVLYCTAMTSSSQTRKRFDPLEDQVPLQTSCSSMKL